MSRPVSFWAECRCCQAAVGDFVVRRRNLPTVWSRDLNLAARQPELWDPWVTVVILPSGLCFSCSESANLSTV